MRLRPRVVLLAATVAVGSPPSSWPCSEGSPGPIWAFTMHPDLPLPPYARGRLGIVQPSFARSYLAVAYLHFQGRKLTASEQESLLELWTRRIGPRNARGTEPPDYWDRQKAAKEWEKARAESGAPPLGRRLETWRATPEYSYYLNCPDAAFLTAAATLRERARAHGPSSPTVLAWREAQDQVFANCGNAATAVIPAPLAGGDALARADRAYQVAAAHFYAGHFEDAARLFRAIGGDPASPWRGWGDYLAARAVLRLATTSPGPPSAQLLRRAQNEFDALLGSRPPAELRRLARLLRDRVALTLDPLAQAHALAARLLDAGAEDEIGHLVDDYTRALDEVWRAAEWGTDWSAEGKDDLTIWIMTFQTREPQQGAEARLAYALQRWKATRALPWLVAAISFVPPRHPEVGTLLEAARAVPIEAPAGPTLAYHRVRLMSAAGRPAEATRLLDDLLDPKRAGELGPSARNLFLDQRLSVAVDLRDLDAHLPRQAVAWGWDFTGELPEEGEAPLEATSTSPLGAALLSGLPLSELRRVALDLDGPEGLQREIARAAWTKALVLQDEATLTALEGAFPGIGPAPAPSSGGLARLLHLLKDLHPPWVDPQAALSGGGRWDAGASPSGIGWWCGAASEYAGVPSEPPAFLGGEDAKRAREEWARVDASGSGPEFACRRAVRLARAAPDDPAAPEALHLAVAATRWGCPGGAIGDASREAFRLLHRSYPRSPWTRKTRYWYAGRW